jgi:hypothetical protein
MDSEGVEKPVSGDTGFGLGHYGRIDRVLQIRKLNACSIERIENVVTYNSIWKKVEQLPKRKSSAADGGCP